MTFADDIAKVAEQVKKRIDVVSGAILRTVFEEGDNRAIL